MAGIQVLVNGLRGREKGGVESIIQSGHERDVEGATKKSKNRFGSFNARDIDCDLAQ